MTALVVIEAVALVLLAMLVAGLLRSHADILRALDDLGAGREGAPPAKRADVLGRSTRDQRPTALQTAHELRGHTIDGESIAVAFGDADESAVLAFLSANCHSCEPFWKEFAQPRSQPDDLRLIVVVQGADNLSLIRRLAGDDLLVVVSDDAWFEYEVPGSPHFVLIDGGAVAGEGTGADWQQVTDLLRHAGGVVDGRALWASRDNAARIDRELADAGILPGHPSLYADTTPGTERVDKSPTV
jgi:hypothetical protein